MLQGHEVFIYTLKLIDLPAGPEPMTFTKKNIFQNFKDTDCNKPTTFILK